MRAGWIAAAAGVAETCYLRYAYPNIFSYRAAAALRASSSNLYPASAAVARPLRYCDRSRCGAERRQAPVDKDVIARLPGIVYCPVYSADAVGSGTANIVRGAAEGWCSQIAVVRYGDGRGMYGFGRAAAGYVAATETCPPLWPLGTTVTVLASAEPEIDQPAGKGHV